MRVLEQGARSKEHTATVHLRGRVDAVQLGSPRKSLGPKTVEEKGLEYYQVCTSRLRRPILPTNPSVSHRWPPAVYVALEHVLLADTFRAFSRLS